MLDYFHNKFFGLRTHHHLQINALDGVRGLAVLFVLFSHAANRDLVLFPDFKLAGGGSGQLGVYLFFGLSAFLLTRALIRRDHKTLKEILLWIDYFFRRVLRIYPLYIVVLFIIWVGSINGVRAFFRDFHLQDVWSHVLLQEGEHHLWTIGVEVRYYFVLPVFVLIFVFLLKRNVALMTIVSLAAMFLSGWYFTTPKPILKDFRFLPLFLGGSLFAVLHEWYQTKDKKLPSWVLTIVGIFCLATIVFLMPGINQLVLGERTRFSRSALFPWWGLLFGLLIFVVVNDKGLLNRLFSVKAIRLIGIISFSIYLWHLFVMNWVVRLPVSTPIKIVIFFGGTFLVSGISFLLFERPFSKVRIYQQDRIKKKDLEQDFQQEPDGSISEGHRKELEGDEIHLTPVFSEINEGVDKK